MKKQTKWTHFWDMHSGGSQKEQWHDIFIEAPEDEAMIIFQNRFGHNPNRVTCTCCGPDYSISESSSLEQATGYHRGCAYVDGKYVEHSDPESSHKKYTTLAEYKKRNDVLIIFKKDIKPEEREGELREEGYIWKD